MTVRWPWQCQGKETLFGLEVYCDWNRAPSQYPKRRLSVRSRKVSKPRDLYLELSDHSEILQALRQQCCRCACQISKRYDNLKYQSRGFETLRDLTKRRLFGYWDGALIPLTKGLVCSFDTLFDFSLNKLIGKQWSFRWDTMTPIWSHIYVCRNIKMAYHDAEQIQ